MGLYKNVIIVNKYISWSTNIGSGISIVQIT